MPDPMAGLPPRFLRTPEAARYLGLSGRTLEKHRTYGTGPTYRKIGGRVVYALDDLKAWADLGAKTSTSDPGEGDGPACQETPGSAPLCGPGTSLMCRESLADAAANDDPSAISSSCSCASGDLAPRDAQDLMAYPFFSLAKSKRVVPIDFRAGAISIRVEAVPEHGMATIWDADVLIWAASQIVEARDAGLKTSRLMAATPDEILTFVGRGTSARDYDRLKAGARPVAGDVGADVDPSARRTATASFLLDQRMEGDGGRHRASIGLELIRPDWFYAGVLDEALVLTIDRAYFRLTGGLERWLYRLVRKHGGRQQGGWSFDSHPAASRRSNTLPSTCARSSAGRPCLATTSSSRATQTA